MDYIRDREGSVADKYFATPKKPWTVLKVKGEGEDVQSPELLAGESVGENIHKLKLPCKALQVQTFLAAFCDNSVVEIIPYLLV